MTWPGPAGWVGAVVWARADPANRAVAARPAASCILNMSSSFERGVFRRSREERASSSKVLQHGGTLCRDSVGRAYSSGSGRGWANPPAAPMPVCG
jgi:hypothetical protein